MTIAQDIRKVANTDVDGDVRDRLNKLAGRVEACEERERFLECLEACGVDNWDGIDYAFEMMDEG